MNVSLEIISGDGLNEIKNREKIGSYGSGIIVYNANWRGQRVVIKELKEPDFNASALDAFQKECQIMAKLRSQHLVRLYAITYNPYGIVMERVDGGTLRQRLELPGKISWQQRYQWAKQVGKGLEILHAAGILHREIKSENVLLTNTGQAKLGDLGLAKLRNTSKKARCSTEEGCQSYPWLAPDLLKRNAKYTERSDVYSYGVLLWEIASRKLPFDAVEMPKLIPMQVLMGELKLENPEKTPKAFGDLIQSCCDVNPDKRPAITEVVAQLSQILKAEKEKMAKESKSSLETEVIPPKKAEESALEQTKDLFALIERYRTELKEEVTDLANQNIADLKNEFNQQLLEIWTRTDQMLTRKEFEEIDKAYQAKNLLITRELQGRKQEISDLNAKIAEAKSNNKDSVAWQERVRMLEELIRPMENRLLFQKKLAALFELDEDNPNKSIENFFYAALGRLTAFAIGVKGLDSGLIERAKTWKDDAAAGLFWALNTAADVTGTVASGFFGAGAAIPLLIKPVFNLAELGWGKYRNLKKEKEIAQASTYYQGGLEEIDSQNRYVAYGLAYMLHKQLPYCTKKGGQQIVDDWLARLSYNVLKQQGTSDGDIQKITNALMRIDQSKSFKHDIPTLVKNRKWNTEGLFERSGIAYEFNGQTRYEYCYAMSEKKGMFTEVETTNVRKYGYHVFPTIEEAVLYKKYAIEEMKAKDKHRSLNWKEHPSPLGPESLTGDPVSLAARKQLLNMNQNLKAHHEEVELKMVMAQNRVKQHDKRFNELKCENEELRKKMENMEKLMQGLLSDKK